MVENIRPIIPEPIRPSQPPQKPSSEQPSQIESFKNILSKKLEEISGALLPKAAEKIDLSEMSKILDNLKNVVKMYIDLVEAFGREVSNFEKSVYDEEGKINRESFRRIVSMSQESVDLTNETAKRLNEIYKRVAG